MFFPHKDSFKLNSIFGEFENQLKYNEYHLNKDTNNDNTFDIILFENFKNQDSMKWYQSMIDTLTDKKQKLRPENINKTRNYNNIAPSIAHNTIPIEHKSPLVYSPKSPPSQKSPHMISPKEPKQTTQIDKPTLNQPTNERANLNRNCRNQNNNDPSKWIYPWSKNKKALQIMKQWYPLRFKLNYPKQSSLTSNEQSEYLDLHNIFCNRTTYTSAETKKYKLYTHYKTLINKERIEFMSYLERYYHKAGEDYEFINQNNIQYITVSQF
jgi:hypothetical protein